MANFYCEYCGTKYPSISALTSVLCPRHPAGSHKGKHKLYEGGEKSEYLCKYCGTKYPSLTTLTSTLCPRHPDGPHKGKHAPAL